MRYGIRPKSALTLLAEFRQDNIYNIIQQIFNLSSK